MGLNRRQVRQTPNFVRTAPLVCKVLPFVVRMVLTKLSRMAPTRMPLRTLSLCESFAQPTRIHRISNLILQHGEYNTHLRVPSVAWALVRALLRIMVCTDSVFKCSCTMCRKEKFR